MSYNQIGEVVVIVFFALIFFVPLISIIEGKFLISTKIRSKFSKRKIQKKISLLVPFRADDEIRRINWEVLKRFWELNLPEAELIVESDKHYPFCKTAAINRAFRKSRGDIIVILDADCLINPEVIKQCAHNIREAREEGYPLWYIPYRYFYRLTEDATTITRLFLRIQNLAEEIVDSSDEFIFDYLGNPPERWMWEHEKTRSSAHWFGALIQIMPREAFESINGYSESFKGWGGEDASGMHAVDTMYAKHRTFDSPVYHLWHPFISNTWGTRLWKGQTTNNGELAKQYEAARGDRLKMSKLIDQYHEL